MLLDYNDYDVWGIKQAAFVMILSIYYNAYREATLLAALEGIQPGPLYFAAVAIGEFREMIITRYTK